MSLLLTAKNKNQPTWLHPLRQYRMQFKFIVPAATVFTAGGMKMGWCIFELPPDTYDCDINTHFLTILWLAGVIFGVLVASFFSGRVTKNIAHISSGFLLLFGGLYFAILPTTFAVIVCCCIFEGAAFGVMQLHAFITSAEVANKDIRGLVMSTERCFIWFGILVQLMGTYIWYALEPTTGHTMHADQIHGIVVACLGIITILWTLKKLRNESPVLLIKQQRNEAIDVALQQLLGANTTHSELIRMREDYRQLLHLDADDSCWYIFRKHNMPALLKLTTMRCFVALSMSKPFNQIYLSTSWVAFDCDMNCLYTLAIAALLGSLLGGLIVDQYGRRKLCAVTIVPATIFMFIACGLLNYVSQAEIAISESDMEVVSIMILFYQLTSSIGISTIATVYLSEAFTTRHKPSCIAVVLIVENLLQILMTVIALEMTINGTYLFFSIGIMHLQLGLYVFFCMPETKRLTLYECLLKFKGAP